MEDSEIVTLYWQRDQTVIQETQRSYGRYLAKIAYGILLLIYFRPSTGWRAGARGTSPSSSPAS